ncbi:FIST signal transduction protein [Maribacter sp. MAR_2009_72]|uniref:FIST signal transduction protein n=1 Tax=Maribacter sp. MAR_2009_72 TaxID=1250050 RepID=UPI00119BC4F4|nr:FIST N-terminal domain-containing protein [Maribacter sp. MAR_2009_72]TVZ14035.1 hypothetical protein JM81_0233 [Maribacter sp. MAR_2009_72]
MRIFQQLITSQAQIEALSLTFVPDVIFLFASLKFEDIDKALTSIQQKYTQAIIIGGTTAGEIIDQQVIDDSIVLSAVKFNGTKVKLYAKDLPTDVSQYFDVGNKFVQDIDQEDLKHIFLISDVQTLHASNLLKGINHKLKSHISVTGGLAGRESYIGSNYIIDQGSLKRNRVIALAMYGDRLQVNYNAQGGWDSYGVECLVTKSEKNQILEIDGLPALDFYKSVVEPNILSDVKQFGFKHPIKVRNKDHSNPVIRALLDIDESNKSLIMAEEIPIGSYVRIMKANVDRLILGAENAAKTIAQQNKHEHELAILISCAGRRKVLGKLAKEEVEAVVQQFPSTTKSIGFYSYGEISPFFEKPKTSLHNLTMCVTTFSEL